MSNIKELCKDISFNHISNWMNITQRKLNNAQISLGINNDELILFYDSSMFENGKTGLALCEGGIYWKNAFFTPRYLSWDAFKKTKLSYDSTNIYFGDKGNVSVISSEVEELVQTLNSIRISIKVEGFFGFIQGAINFINELDSTDSNTNEQTMIADKSNEVVEVAYKEEENTVDYEILDEQIKLIKGFLMYNSRDIIGNFINNLITNKEELMIYIMQAIYSVALLNRDEKFLKLIESQKETVMKQEENIDLSIQLTENILNSDVISEIGKEKISLKRAIKLYYHRVNAVIEEFNNGDDDLEKIYNNIQESEIEEVHSSIQVAVEDFRSTLKTMIKYCNLLVEKIYMES